ncbi:MAG: AI-2E family transporter [Anaerovoracaceae bacterium]|jgi:predicted PurR-regulated permease PerM
MRRKVDAKYIKWGLTVFATAVLIIIVFFMFYRNTGLGQAIGKLNAALMPFVWGLVMAYLLCPLYNLCVRSFSKVRWPKMRGRDYTTTVSKALATIISLAVLLGIVVGILALIIPQMVQSITSIAQELPTWVRQIENWIDDAVAAAQLRAPLEHFLGDASTNFIAWVQDKIVPGYDKMVSGVAEVGMRILTLLKNFFLGLIICAFFINSKDIFAAQCKKLILAIFNENHADKFLRGAAYVNKTFGGFINGKLLDSLIVGIICFICMSLFRWPYAVLISVIVGVTNFIPFFGPFIGAIPSALLLLMVDPLTCLQFLIFILILQQVDGNIIGPKILGDSTGLSSFWVMFAILVGGALFGFGGLVLGIPVFACFYALMCYLVNRRLDKKGLSVDLRDYRQIYKYKGIKGMGQKQQEEDKKDGQSQSDQPQA